MRRSGTPRPLLTLSLAGLCLLPARHGLAGEVPPLPEGSVARLGRGEIQLMTLSAAGTRLVLGSKYGVWLQDGHTGADLARLQGTSEGVGLLALSPDGSTLAGGSEGGWVRLWDLNSGRYEDSLERHKGMVVALAFSPDGSLLATAGGKDRRVRLWSVETGRTEAILAGHRWDVLSVAFSPDGKTLASGSADGTIRLWSVDEGLHTATLEELGTWVHAVAFSPDGSMLAGGGRNGEVGLWDVATGRHQVLPHRHKGMVYFLAFTPDGGTLASGDDDTEVRLWDVASAQPGASFKEDWRRIAGRRHPGRILSVAFRPEGGAVVSFGSPYEVRRWDVESGQLEAILSLETEHMEYVESVAFSPDGKSLASTGYDNAVRLWDVEGRRLRTVLYGHWRRVLAVAFSPDGSLLASGGRDLTVRLWDVGSGRHLATLGGGAGTVEGLAFSPDGASLANTAGQGRIFLWSVADARLKAILDVEPSSASRVAFSPDGRTLASGGQRVVRLWDADTGNLLANLEESSSRWSSRWSRTPVAFSPDGRILAGGGSLLRLWDTDTGELRGSLEGADYRAVTFSPDGRILAGSAGSLGLWDTDTWELRSVLEGQGDETPVLSVAFSPGGALLASGSDGTILLWDMSPHLAGPTSIGLSPALPATTALLSSYPNPFNQETWIPFQLHTPARVLLTVRDVRGALVREIDLGHRPAGWYRTSGRAARWDGRGQRGESLASGVYFARLQAGAIVQMRKMLLLK